MSDPIVLIRCEQPAVVTVTLNRPEKRNALSEALMESLCEAIDQVRADSFCRVLILGATVA